MAVPDGQAPHQARVAGEEPAQVIVKPFTGAAQSGTFTEAQRRIAFLTPEFPTEKVGAGGVGNYVDKMSNLLAAAGHDVTVFVTSSASGTVYRDGVTVVRVPSTRSVVWRGLSRLLKRIDVGGGELPLHLANARSLAKALSSEHQRRPFDLVQSANYHLVGLYVPKAARRKHLVRISTSRILYDPAYGRAPGPLTRLTERLDVRTQRRADGAYAPSRLLQRYFQDTYGHTVAVLRPPMPTDVANRGELPTNITPPYLVHFGSLGARKGTDVVSDALPIAWRSEPDLRMVFVGPFSPTNRERFTSNWGQQADQVLLLGPLDKSSLYAVVAGAAASVLPSRMDNLPNTVIESLALGTPVIGSDGASIDELVTPGSNGVLVPIGDAKALAEAMVAAYRGELAGMQVGVPADMEPAVALEGLFSLMRS
ncbi:MAG TPA: glycosyltransferase family 4 protein [Trueperaceae bacterium]|nr:glycosyltransferase family 4 protein [Trueperaceae bacterium]